MEKTELVGQYRIPVQDCCVPCLGKTPQEFTPATRTVTVTNFPDPKTGEQTEKDFQVCICCFVEAV